MLSFRLPQSLVLVIGLLALTGCFEAESPIYTADDLWRDIPDDVVQTVLAAPFFPEREMKVSDTGGGSFMVMAEGTECPFGIAVPKGADTSAGIDIAVFNLAPDCHFNMADSPWMIYAARIFPPGHPRHEAGIAFGVPGDSAAITVLAQDRGVRLEPYRTSGEDRYRVVSDAASFKAFLAAYMQSDLVDFGK